MKQTEGEWYHSTIAHEKIEGAEYSKIYSGKGIKKRVIGRINATHKEEGYANLKLAVAAPLMLKALKDSEENIRLFFGREVAMRNKSYRQMVEAIKKATE